MATHADLRAFAIRRSLFPPTTLSRAVEQLGFIQADPIRAPARAQDLTLRHRVTRYRAGDLDRRYPELEVEEDFFVNYGFLHRDLHRLIHPRRPLARWPTRRMRVAEAILDFVRARGAAHPREVDAEFGTGTTTNWFGGQSRVSTRLLEGMHFRGMLRVLRRDGGIRVYAPGRWPLEDSALDGPARMDGLIDAVVRKYAPLPARSLAEVTRSLRYGTPHLAAERMAGLARARQRLNRATVDGMEWYWPADESLGREAGSVPDAVRFLAPFDPVVWDRRRFEIFWDWSYRFEAYTPAARRKLGYYALPLLRRDRVIGWATVAGRGASMRIETGYVRGNAPADRTFRRELEAEVERMREFLG